MIINNFTEGPLTLEEYRLLFNGGVPKSAMVKEMLSMAKKNYVLNLHPYAITHMVNAKGYKKGKWKTYVLANEKRKEVIAGTEEELYERLYKHYMAVENAGKTYIDVFEMLCSYKKDCLNRSQNTISEDRTHFNTLSQALQNKIISEITDEDMSKAIVSDVLSLGPKLSRFKKILQTYDQTFEYGIKKKLCVDNPMKYISAKDYYKFCDISEKTDEEKAFSKEELELLEEDAKKHPDNPRVLMSQFAKESGCRAGEICAIHKEDILDEYVHIHRQQIRVQNEDKNIPLKQIHYEVPFTKDERVHPHDGRYVPITVELRKVIDLALAIEGDSVYLFHDKGKSEMITSTSYSHNLRTRCKRLGCIATNNHAFRMAYNSRLIELGFSASDRALILGHQVQTNEAHYSLTDRRRLETIKNRIIKKEEAQ